MSDINYQMQTVADYAIKTAKDKFGQDLDYSEQSIAKLDTILMQVYSHFSNQIQTEEITKALNDAAVIWGSFLGEYMCRKWGGSWNVKGTDRIITILNMEFSPISFIFQKITNHPEYNVEIFLFETKKVIYLSVINPQPAQSVPDHVGQPEKEILNTPQSKKVNIDKRFVIILAATAGIMLTIFLCYIGFVNINKGGLAAFGIFSLKSSETPIIVIPTNTNTSTLPSTPTQIPTMTTLPTYTPNPTFTPRPSLTPYRSPTPRPTNTSTITQTSTHTLIPRRTPTIRPTDFTETPVPPTDRPAPTATIPEPVVLESCDIDPSTVPVNTNVGIAFIAHFSGNSNGYGFDTSFDSDYPGQSGCSGVDSNGDGLAYCDGSSGELPASATVYVTFSSSVGECVASYTAR